MAQAENKTKPTPANAQAFISSIDDPQRRQDSMALLQMMQEITGEQPIMWGPAIIGFGQYHYKYESGREGDALAVGFSPRKAALTVYFADGVSKYQDSLATLGPHKLGKGCLYIKRLSDVDVSVLKAMIGDSYRYVMAHKRDMHRAQ